VSLTEYPNLEQRSPQWYAARCGIVTASAVGELVTASTLKVASNDKARGIIASLVAERITGIVEPTFTTDDMWRGIEHEPYARDIYSGHYQQAVEHGFMRLDGDGWSLGYSPDGLVADEGLVEIKCPRAKGHVATILADEVPAHYMAQLQAGLLVSGRKWIDYVSFCAGLPLFVKRVLPDPAWQGALVAACRNFETVAAEMVAAYSEKTKDMPATERIDMEIVI
jgi:putative phage-type endonuclease